MSISLLDRYGFYLLLMSIFYGTSSGTPLKLRRMRALCLLVGSALLNANIGLQIWFIHLVLRKKGVQDIQLLILVLAFSCYQTLYSVMFIIDRWSIGGNTRGPFVTVVWFENNMLTSLCACEALQKFFCILAQGLVGHTCVYCM